MGHRDFNVYNFYKFLLSIPYELCICMMDCPKHFIKKKKKKKKSKAFILFYFLFLFFGEEFFSKPSLKDVIFLVRNNTLVVVMIRMALRV